MAGITLAQAEAQLAAWIAASTALASSQSYTIEVDGSKRSLTRADAAEVRTNVEFWDGWVKRLTPNTRNRTRYAVIG